MSLHSTVRRTSRAVEGLVLLALPHGGQQAARRNAWASMASDSARARARREADAAMNRAVDLAGRTVTGPAIAQ
jgi:hypothetical protein